MSNPFLYGSVEFNHWIDQVHSFLKTKKGLEKYDDIELWELKEIFEAGIHADTFAEDIDCDRF